MGDDEYIRSVTPPRRVKPGVRDAVLVHHEIKEYSGCGNRRELIFRFKLCEDPSNGVMLDGFCSLPKTGKAALARSKLARWYSVLVGFTGARRDRVSVRQFYGVQFRLLVETVKKNQLRRPLPAEAEYEVVREILGVVGRVGKTSS